ncbi:MAG: transposase [bacterium]|nr:transposase [bacterium]
MRKEAIAPGEYYHIYNRGVSKRIIFYDESDYARMLFLILFCQSPILVYNIGQRIKSFSKTGDFHLAPQIKKRILENRSVELTSFVLMPNHFHLKVCERDEGGISAYLQKVEIAYTKYFNAKYKHSGHLFQGPFKSVHVKTNEQALHLSAYLHRNPRELAGWKNKEQNYPWSSCQDYIGQNRWGEFVKRELILEQFSSPKEYREFLDSSPAKAEKILEPELLIDSNY